MKAKSWLNIGLAMTMLATVGLVGCGTKDSTDNSTASKTDSTQELNLALSDEIPTMDLSKATNAISFTLFANINEGLTRLDKDGKAQPALADKWEVSADGKTYTFHIRDGVKWSNGDPVTAKDFEYSWKRTLDPKTAAEYAFMVAWVKGGDEYNQGKGSVDEVGVKAKDDKTLVVELVNPISYFPEQMAFPIFFAQNEKFVTAAGDKYGAEADKVLNNGPFKFTSWVHEQSATLEKNDTYWDASKVKLKKVNYQVVKDSNAALNLYESGQLDRTGLVRDQVDNYKGKPEFATQPELTTGYIQYNQKVPVLKNAKVRQALTWAIDGDQYADVVYHNGTVGATGYTPKGISNGQGGDFTKDVGDLINRKDNKAKAKATLQEGLKEAGLTEFPKIKLLSDDGDVGKKSTEFIKEQWRQNLGIDVDIETVPYKLRLQRSHGHDFDMVVSLWGADYNDPMTFLDMFITGGSFNDPSWSNATYDELIKNGKTEADPKKRMTYLYDAEKLLMKEMPIGPLYFRAKAYVNKPYLKNFQWRVFGPDYELKETYVEGK
ncbi:peptide ABC transporter substrate-binding protein [Tumebacillus permanentifrigoris]|uniref:Oligopeptide transport system substrate-binding protein n=1 Tax=Tumebacillus permanentifrigoris TaxID=378543 RepID=A0A316D770_9BACL|nr:peptide ABC transporter substrate-binding protein [Tumebacillus permanentifrigoris]PWK11574.1 oligopeptide transport system substrate-binding protein [Tumebacillus permanentifrigoris]